MTEKRRREEALQARENRLRALANSVPGGIFQFEVLPSGEQEFTFVSEQAEELLGISSAPEGYFDRFVRRVPLSHRRRLLESIEEAIRERREWSYEMPFDRPDGKRVWVKGISTPERRDTADGEKLVYHGIVIDTTDRKRAERRYEAIFNQTFQLIGLMEPDGTLIEANDTALEAGGLTEGDVLGKPFWETYWFQTGEGAPERLREAVRRAREGEFVRYEETIQSANGPIVTDFSIRPIMGEDGKVRLLLPEGRDITERKRAEWELERQNDLFRKAQDIANVGAWEYDVRPGHLHWTDEVYRIHDIPLGENVDSEEALGFYHPEDRPTIESLFKRAVQEGEPYDVEVRMITANGDRRWVRASGYPQVEEGEVTYVRGTFQDITERKERERELREAKEAAEEASRLKSTLLANMSHEFRTPLTSILGFADAIREEASSVQTEGLAAEVAAAIGSAERFAGLIRKGGERLQGTLTSVLKLSQLEAEETDLELQDCNLTEAAEEALSSARAQAEEAGLSVDIQYPEDPVWAPAHPGGLAVALKKILGNAIKFTDPGGEITLRIREEWGQVSGEDSEEGSGEGSGEARPGSAVIEIEDSGIGMDPDEVQRLFEAFEQESEGLAREYEGSGLGLSVARRLIEQMGGTIDVATEKGKGSRFAIRLPREKPEGS